MHCGSKPTHRPTASLRAVSKAACGKVPATFGQPQEVPATFRLLDPFRCPLPRAPTIALRLPKPPAHFLRKSFVCEPHAIVLRDKCPDDFVARRVEVGR